MAKIRSKITGDVFEAFTQDFTNEPDFEIVHDSTPVTGSPPNATAAGGMSAPAATDSTSGTTDGTVDTPSVTSTDPAVVSDPNAPSLPATTSSNVSSGLAPTSVESTSSTDASTAVTTDPSVSATPASADSSEGVDSGNVGAAPAALQYSPQADGSLGIAAIASDTSADLGNVNESASNTQGSALNLNAPLDGSTAVAGAGDAGNVQAPTASSVADSGSSEAVTQETSSELSPVAAGVGAVDTSQPPVTDSVTGSPTGGPTAGSGNTLDAKSKHIVADQLESDTLFAIAQIVTPSDSLRHAADAFFDQVRSQIDVEAAA